MELRPYVAAKPNVLTTPTRPACSNASGITVSAASSGSRPPRRPEAIAPGDGVARVEERDRNRSPSPTVPLPPAVSIPDPEAQRDHPADQQRRRGQEAPGEGAEHGLRDPARFSERSLQGDSGDATAKRRRARRTWL